MRYESYFRDPRFRKQADKIISEFKKIRKTLLKVNDGLKYNINKIDKLINEVKTDPNEEKIQKIKETIFDIKVDVYALIEKGDSIISEMRINYFKKSPKLEFKNREIIEEYNELVELIHKKFTELEVVLNNGCQSNTKN